MASLGDMYVTVGAKIAGFEMAMGTVSQRLRLIDRDVNKTFGGFDKIGDKLSTVGQAATIGISLPLAAAGVAVTKLATDFDLGMRKVTSLMGGSTMAVFASLSKEVLQLSRDLGVDAVGATKALYQAISAGVPKENAIDFLRVASVAAIAGVTNTEVAVDALTTIIAAYNLKVTDAKAISDAMFQAVNIGKMTFEQLAAAIGPAAQQAQNLGVSYEELLAATATLSLTSGGASQAVTQIESAMRALLDPSKELKAVFVQLNVASGTDLIKKYGGLEGALQAMRETTHGNAEAFNKLFGRIEGLTGALGLTGDKAAKAAADYEQMKHATDGLGAAQTAMNEINKSTARQFEMALTAIKATAIEMGTALLPAVNSLLQASKPLIAFLTDAVKWFTALPESIQLTVLGFTAAIAIIGPLMMGLGTLISTISQVSAAFMSLAGISGIGAVMPALAQLPGMFSNVAFAVANGLTGALTGGELMLLRFGQAALVAGAAFAGWKLGEWAYANIPGVKALGDAMGDLILKIPGVEYAVLRLSGASAATAGAQAGLALATEKLEAALRRKGITVEHAGLTTEQYADKLRAAAREAGLMGTAHDTERVKIDAMKKQIGATDAQSQLYSKALGEMGKGVKAVGADHIHAAKAVKEFEDGIPVAIIAEYERRLKALKTEIAKSTIETTLAKRAGQDWGAQLDENIDQASALSGELRSTAGREMPAYVAGLGKMSAGHKTVTEDLDFIIWQSKRTWDEAAKRADEAAKKSAESWKRFAENMSRAFSNLGQDLLGVLMGKGSIGEALKQFANDMLSSILDKFLKPATDAIGKFLATTIADLIGGKGFGGIMAGLKEIGSAVGGIFGGAGGAAASTATTVAGGGASVAGGVAGAAGQAAGAGVTAIVGAVSQALTAASSIIGNFQFAHMNTALGRIEESTRYLKIWTGEQSQNMLWCLQTMTERSGYQVTALDALGRFASDQLAWLERIGIAIETPSLAGGVLSPEGMTVTVSNNTFSSRDDIDYLIDRMGQRMREVGQTI